MALWGRDKEAIAVEDAVIRGFYAAELSAAESYDAAIERVDEGEVAALFRKLRDRHLDVADDFRKRAKKLGGNPDDRTGIAAGVGEALSRTHARINAVGSLRDLLIAMRQGEENGVAMCREALEDVDLSGRSRSLIEANLRLHIDHIRDLSEQIALRSNLTQTYAEMSVPQWLRYPSAGFWLVEGALVLLGYLFGRGNRTEKANRGSVNSVPGHQSHRGSPRANVGGDQAVQQYGDQIQREVGG